MSASFDLTRAPLHDAQTVALRRRVANLVTGFLATLTGMFVVFFLLYAERWGESYALFLVPALIITLAMIPAYRVGMRLLTQQAVRMDLGPEGVVFHLDDGATRSFRWEGSARQLSWIDGRGRQWPKLPVGWPRTSVWSGWGPLAILPEEAFDFVLATVRGRGVRLERQPQLEKLPSYRGDAVYKVLPANRRRVPADGALR